LTNVYAYPSVWNRGDFPEPVYTTLDPRSLRPINGAELLFIRPMPWWKRSIDLVAAGLALLLLAPLFCVVALAIKLTSRGPVFFKQRRSGLGGRPFTMCKFRTMVVDAEVRKEHLMHANEQDGPAFKIKADPRVTRLGRILRKTSLDELPQLWNVLMGEMSLVGPRPLPCVEMAGCTAWQRRRLDVTPGLTCIWQVYGRSRVTFTEWVQMDVEYIKTQSLFQDLKLILITVPALLFRPGH
jgi:lipopolysaccharide/colanic/teichoic acid biosynthesis glycosyltransferase